jgi:hypothetical protein
MLLWFSFQEFIWLTVYWVITYLVFRFFEIPPKGSAKIASLLIVLSLIFIWLFSQVVEVSA